MRNVLFENRWGALGFVAVIVFIALILVGDEGREGAVGRFASADGAPRAQASVTPGPVVTPRPVAAPPVVTPGESQDFADDDNLIDEATGDDPNPPDVEADEDPQPTIGPVVVAGPGGGPMVPVDEGEIIDN